MPPARTLVLNCAGIGSRLGLGKTKVLMELHGKTLLERHLENFRDVSDLRIVVGYQSADVISAVCAIRNDVVFVYNHDYFETGAGYSFWLGARFGNEMIIQWDGDLIIHRDDARKCLEQDGMFAAYSDKRTEDGVFCSLNDHGNITAFSRSKGEYEWTGPCAMHFNMIEDTDSFIFQMLQKYAPYPGLYVRAMDIDTMSDYYEAEKLINSWENDY